MWDISESKILQSSVYVDFGFYLFLVWFRSIFVFKYIQDIFGGILVSNVLEIR